ncbi:MAG: phospholipid carrier-dependent glycosyltransferase [Gammaproteobacteria bacterium]
MVQAPPHRRLLLVAALWGITWVVLLNAHPLFHPDEGRYAEIPREMVQTGQWTIPHLNDLAYIEKPPLQYWATAVSFLTFGESAWAARLYTGLCGLLTVLLTAFVAKRLWGPDSGWRAGCMAGSSLLLVLLAHHLTLDMSLTFYLAAMVGAFCLAQHQREQAGQARFWMRVAWVCAGLAVMTKGLVALVLPGATLVVYSLLQRDRIVWRHLSIPSGLALLLLVTVPWFVVIQRDLPQFFDFFFIREHFQRYLTRVSDRYEPPWYFIPILIAGCMPWLLPAGRAFVTGWRREAPRGEFDARRFLWVWIVVTFCFFSASDSKLLPYILPLFPALALLMASGDEESLRRDLRRTGIGLIVFGAGLMVLAVIAPYVTPHTERAMLFLQLRPHVGGMGLAALVGGIACRRPTRSSLSLTVATAVSGYVVFALVLVGASQVTPLYSGLPLVEQLRSVPIGQAPFFSVRTYDQTMPFYLGRPLTLVDERNEMDFGLNLEPAKGLASLGQFESRWRELDQAFAIVEPQTFSELREHGLPMVVRARGYRRFIVSKR